MTEKALLFGDDTRSFLAIARSLGRQGIFVHAVPRNFRAAALRSRYVDAIHDVPPWMGDGRQWLAAVCRLLRNQRYDLVIPCDETTLLPMQRYRAVLSRLAPLAIPDDSAIAVLFDKHNTRHLAEQLGVRVAFGRLAEAEDTGEVILRELGMPVVVKPRQSYSLDKLATRGKVRIAKEPEQIEELLRQSAPEEIVLERYFDGRGVGVSVLASGGRVLQAFEHHRVREVSGAGFYRCSAPVASDLKEVCARIVRELNYTGIIMFEFKVNRAGDWIFLEANARPWGSMPLPVALGVDFPYRWYRLLTRNEEVPAVSYRVGVYARNLIPDLRNLVVQAEAQGRRHGVTARAIMQAIWEMRRLISGKEVHDVLVRDDLGPAIAELLEAGHALGRKLKAAIPGEVGRRRRRAHAQVQILRKAPLDGPITFVCQGNICRSPFAAALLRARIGKGSIDVRSAGMMPQPGRRTPTLGLEAAITQGVDLSSHRSIWLTRQMAESASLLIVFDEITRDALLDRYPEIKVPVVRLGDLAGLGEVEDPVDGDLTKFNLVYAQIANAISELASLLRDAHALSRPAGFDCRREGNQAADFD